MTIPFRAARHKTKFERKLFRVPLCSERGCALLYRPKQKAVLWAILFKLPLLFCQRTIRIFVTSLIFSACSSASYKASSSARRYFSTKRLNARYSLPALFSSSGSCLGPTTISATSKMTENSTPLMPNIVIFRPCLRIYLRFSALRRRPAPF